MAESWTNEQKEAIESFGHNILVSAGAGSGKTAVLSERVYTLTGKRKIDIDHLLVLTFTNKAAAEMKSRIARKIKEDRNGFFEAKEKERQINKIDSSFIMTFDAYALFLVKKYHQLLGIDKDINVIDNNILNNKKEELLKALMNEYYSRKDEAFLSLIDTYCVKDDAPVFKAILKTADKIDAVSDPKAYYQNYETRFYSQDAFEVYVQRFEKYLLGQIAKIRTLVNEFSYGVENVSDYFINIDEVLHARSLKQINEAMKSFAIADKKLPKGAGVSEVKKKLTESLKDLQKTASMSPEDLQKELLQNKEHELVLLKLCEELTDQLSAFKKEKNMFSFSDIFHMAIRIVRDYPEIRKEIAEGFDEVLIDEYQDTNDLQDDFISLIEHDNIYMVGDVKQSIYRFRNANPSLFMKKYEDYQDGEKGQLITLPHNFRSRKEVIEDINVIFDRTMDLEVGGADYKLSHHMKNGRKDTVYEGQDPNLEIYTYDYDKSQPPFDEFSRHEVEAFMIAKDIKDKLGRFLVKDGQSVRPCAYKDFCIIIDRGTNFDLYKQIFTYFDIPCVIERDEKMSDSDLIYALKAIFTLLECLNKDEADERFASSFLSLARSFLVDMKDDAIYDVVKNKSYMELGFMKDLSSLAKRISGMSISMILNEVISIFDIYEKIHRIGDVKENYIKIDYLMKLSSSLNQSGYDLSFFNEYLDSLFADEDKDITYAIDEGDKDAVKIINIHKSKGLQYKICYFPALHVNFNLSDINDRFLFSKDEGLIMPIDVKGSGLKDSFRKLLYTDDYYKADIGEKLRLLYVALTRAEEKMIMIAPLEDETKEGEIIDPATRSGYRSFTDLLESIYGDLEAHGFLKAKDLSDYAFTKDYRILKYKDVSSLIDPKADAYVIKNYDRIVPKEVTSSSFSKKAGLIDEKMIERMELGTKLHYYLETLDFKEPDLSKIEKRYVQYIEKFLNSAIMKDRKSGKAYKEYEFIYEEDGQRKHGFIDLLMEYEDHFDIIDYKTKNIDDEHYDEQLSGYRNYIQKISDKKASCYLYSIVDSDFREVK